ncbi:MAG: CAP domain-containing protein [Solirubrobacterales bacterium]
MKHALVGVSKIFLATIAIAAACLLAVPAPAPAATSSCADADALPLSVSQQTFNATITCVLNAERTSRGLRALRSNSKLESAAFGHSTSMRLGGYFEHNDPSGTTARSRVLASGYGRGARRWTIGENLGWGESELGSPRALVATWMNSPTHRAVLLQPRFREIGVGVDWGSPIDPNASAATVTTDFGQVKRRKGQRH